MGFKHGACPAWGEPEPRNVVPARVEADHATAVIGALRVGTHLRRRVGERAEHAVVVAEPGDITMPAHLVDADQQTAAGRNASHLGVPGARDVEPVEGSVAEPESVLPALTIGISARHGSVVGDAIYHRAAARSLSGPWIVDGRERAAAQPEPMLGVIAADIPAHDDAGLIDADRGGALPWQLAGRGHVDRRENAVPMHEPMQHAGFVLVIADDGTSAIGRQRARHRRMTGAGGVRQERECAMAVGKTALRSALALKAANDQARIGDVLGYRHHRARHRDCGVRPGREPWRCSEGRRGGSENAESRRNGRDPRFRFWARSTP